MLTLNRTMGGKARLVKYLLPLVPPHKCYVEVFGGGAALLLNKPQSKVEVYNDLDDELFNLFRVVREDPERFVRSFDLMLYSRTQRELYKAMATPKTPLERAVRYWYLLNTSYSGDIHGGFRGAGVTTTNEARTFFAKLRDVYAVAERLRNVIIEHMDFRKLLSLYDSPRTFFFCDPPYFSSSLDYYDESFVGSDHAALSRALDNVRGKWLLIYDDCPEVRALYSHRRIVPLNLRKDAGPPRDFVGRDIFKYVLIGNYF